MSHTVCFCLFVFIHPIYFVSHRRVAMLNGVKCILNNLWADGYSIFLFNRGIYKLNASINQADMLKCYEYNFNRCWNVKWCYTRHRYIYTSCSIWKKTFYLHRMCQCLIHVKNYKHMLALSGFISRMINIYWHFPNNGMVQDMETNGPVSLIINTLTLAWISNYIHKCVMKLWIHSQTSTVQPTSSVSSMWLEAVSERQ